MTQEERIKALKEIAPKKYYLDVRRNKAIDECVEVFEEQVILREELLSVEEIKEICINTIHPTMVFDGSQINFDNLARAIHTTQQEKLK